MANLSLQTNGNKAELTNRQNTQNILSQNLSSQAAITDSIELNGEDFILLPVSGRVPRFNARNIEMGLRPAPGTTTVHAFKAEHKVENEISSTVAASFLGALFPVSGILETLKHFVEITHKMTEGNSINIKLTQTQNINPKDAINPNKSFLPVSPFVIPNKPTMELWQKKKESLAIESEKKKKKKKKGLGSF